MKSHTPKCLLLPHDYAGTSLPTKDTRLQLLCSALLTLHHSLDFSWVHRALLHHHLLPSSSRTSSTKQSSEDSWFHLAWELRRWGGSNFIHPELTQKVIASPWERGDLPAGEGLGSLRQPVTYCRLLG